MKKFFPLYLFVLAILLVSSHVSGGGPVGGGPVGGFTTPTRGKQPPGFGSSCFVDPANSSLLAADGNSCATALKPIRTTAELNRRLYQALVTTAVTITYMSDDASGTMLDLSTTTVDAPGSMAFVGTPQVLHSVPLATINAGTIAINPTAGGGGQRQVGHTSDLAAFAPFVGTAFGGAAAHPAYVLATSGADSGSSAWIVSGLGATVSLSRPMAAGQQSLGSLTIGDHYTIQRGSTLVIGGNLPVNTGPISFTDFAFAHDYVSTNAQFAPFYFRCSFDITLGVGAACFNCYLNDITFGSGSFFFLDAGVWLLVGSNTAESLIEVTDDTYVTSPNPSFFLPIDNNGYGNIAIFASNATHSGMQVQDFANAEYAIRVGTSPPVLTSINGNGLLWGNGNAGYGIALAPNAGLTVPASVGDVPSITGAAGDFMFLGQNGASIVTSCRPWNEGGNAYGPATATSWANLAGALGFNCHDVATSASIVGL